MLIVADARAIPLRDACVQCVVTSPPYFGLRDYKTPHQIGLEATPDAFVAALVAVFVEVWRVLADDGVVWLNLGDSYVSAPPGHCADAHRASGLNGIGGASYRARVNGSRDGMITRPPRDFGSLKSKDLLGIPWAVAFALRAAGWYLRSDVIWHKPNPMPESVTDRPTKSHEYLFLLTKAERYYYDAKAIAEPVSLAMLDQIDQGYESLGLKDYDAAGVQNPSTVKARIIGNARKNIDGNMSARGVTRNRRTVWTIPTLPYAGAHFATMPEALVEPCVLAGSRLGDLIFDPFSGSGTVLAVATRCGRRAVGTDLNPAYQQQLARERTQQRGLRFDDGARV